MSRSAPSRTRQPLAALPLHHFVPSLNVLPSPISLPTKRHAPSTSDRTCSPEKIRKVSMADRDGVETIRKHRVKEITPKAKEILERDDLGTGKSPARRLFVNTEEGRSVGIVGAVPAPRAQSPIDPPDRSLASSPPTPDAQASSSTANSPYTSSFPRTDPDPDMDHLNPHDPGFIIWSDTSSFPPLGVGIGTPDSKKALGSTLNPNLTLDAIAHIPSSPASSSRSYGSFHDEDQENIPPPSSAYSTPSKHSQQSSPKSSARSIPSSRHSVDDDYVSTSGRKRSKTIERSRLGLGSIVPSKPRGVEEDEGDEADELTPGRRVVDKRKEKGRLTREVDRI